VSLARRARSIRNEPLFRSSFALILNTLINGLLGFAYWVIAARLYSAAAVGEGAGAVSAMLLVSSIGWIGLQHVLMRYLPVAGSRSGRLIGLAYAVALAAALPASVIFLVYAVAAGTLPSITGHAIGFLAFVASIVVWVVFSLQDAAMIGIRRSTWVPIENAAFGIVKIVILVAFAATASAWAIMGSWVLPAAILVVVVNWILARSVLPTIGNAPTLPSRRRLAQFAAGHQAVALVGAAPDSLVPLILLAILGREANAYYYVAWTVSFSLRLIAVNIGSALTVEGSTAGRLGHLTGSLRVLVISLFVPIVVGVWLGADLILAVFGGSYRVESADLLRLFALGLIPFTAVTLFVAGERVHQRSRTALAIVGVATTLTIVLDIVLLPSAGIAGAGIAWLIAQSISLALAAAVVARRRRKGPSGGGAPPVDGEPAPARELLAV
jgi:O-antigen/teichoic acid export membrane protein